MKKLWLIALTLALAVALAGCGKDNNDSEASPSSSQSASASPIASASQAASESAPASEAAAKKTEYPLTVKDATGTEFTFDKAPEKIVSTSVSETEILFALGLGDKVVGVSDYDNYPPEALEKQKVGGVSEPNVEAIIALEPDLVITGISIKDTAVEKFRSLDLKLVKTEPKSIEDVLGNILLIGQITDKQTEAEALVAQMREDVRKVTEAAATIKPEGKKKVYIEFSPGWTVGKGEFMDELITLAGGVNIASDMQGWNPINEEKVIADNPDVIIYTLNITDEKSGKKLEDLIQGRSGWDKIKAIADKQLIGMDGDILSRPGPRITEALKQLSEGIYPGLVKSE
ncbi:ABC transporter substrate-binding protein [Cohnella cholangitidis]|uniref:ABC transporter substrate-binding protein n=1 Tax=Cohnella cholangitidis TaxID=2598458 RepID=A0A7G5BWZ8_9BACL|nr:ABC transporter substrate-binding protein [Cohnella cholangitidis]QMV41482.1 ABC transporter substrate-binding protein [Cohnella cholangitidis]